MKLFDLIVNGSLLTGGGDSGSSTAFLPEECQRVEVLVCPNNETDVLGCLQDTPFLGDHDETYDLQEAVAEPEAEFKLRFLTNPWSGFDSQGKAFEALFAPGTVSIEFVKVDFPQLFPDIINEAQSQTGLYDGFLTPPSIAGSVVPYDGWKDLTPFIQESTQRLQDWSDILLGYRQYIAQYEGKIIMFPLDGDILSLYYRKDILEAFNLEVPRTWDEYSQVASQVHGKTFENKTLVGSCIGRTPNCAGAYWANLLISSMTQTQGQWSGHLFDTSNMQPLTGEAIEQALEWMETQVLYGPDNEFDGCIDINSQSMTDGNCVLTYNWGNQFKEHLKEGLVLHNKLGVAPTPGSRKVLDRSNNKLVDCDAELCKYGDYYEDIGWVNRAPYLAFGGWSCAVNNYASDPRKQRLATEFCAFASSQQGSMEHVIPNATGQVYSGQDPFRKSHLNKDQYVQQGYEPATSEEFIQSIQQGLDSQNVVTDIRFPASDAIHAVLDAHFVDYLNKTKHSLVFLHERQAARAEISQQITNEWQQIIETHDEEEANTAQYTILESYQRLRDVYINNVDMNQLGLVRIFPFVLGGILLLLSIGFGIWSIVYKDTRVVRASQPIFLVMVCVGAATMASCVVLMGIDDEIASPDTCSKVCMAIPWLLFLGWVIVFSALQSKLRRINLVFKNAQKFKRLKVTEKDVLPIFIAFFTINSILLLLWTILEPVVWKREAKSELESYGGCSWNLESTTAQVLVSLLAIVNFLALVLANVEAYKNRNVSTEYGESRYIGLAMGSILQATLVALPLFILVDENPSAYVFVQASFVFIAAASILLLIFVPKVLPEEERTSKKMRNSSIKDGLAFRIINTDVFAKDNKAELVKEEYKKKLEDLTAILKAEGLNADELFQRAGLGPKGTRKRRVSSTGEMSSVDGMSSIGSVISLDA